MDSYSQYMEPWGEGAWTAREEFIDEYPRATLGSFENFSFGQACAVLRIDPPPFAPEPPPIRWVRGLVITLLLGGIFEFEVYKIAQTIAQARHGG